jgi:hypothetical protein
MGWQTVYLLAYDLAAGDQPAEQAAEALLACAPERDAHETARLRFLGGRSDPPEDALARRALGYVERSIELGDTSGRWLSLGKGGGRRGSMSAQS